MISALLTAGANIPLAQERAQYDITSDVGSFLTIMRHEEPMKKFTVISAVLLCLVSCTKIDYVGEEYPPTAYVDLFFSFDDVDRDHKVMGHIVATANDLISAEKMQKKMLEKAREKGADGIVILGLGRYVKPSSSFSSTTDDDGQVTTTATTSSEEKKEIRATLLKYK